MPLPAGGCPALGAALPVHRPRFGEEVPAECPHQRGCLHLPFLQFRDVGRQRGAAGGQPEQQLPVHCGPVQQQGPQERQPGAPGHLRGGEDLYHAAVGPADADARHPKLYCGAHQGPRVPPGLQPHRRGVHQNRPRLAPLHQRHGDPPCDLPGDGAHRRNRLWGDGFPAGPENPAAHDLLRPAHPPT